MHDSSDNFCIWVYLDIGLDELHTFPEAEKTDAAEARGTEELSRYSRSRGSCSDEVVRDMLKELTKEMTKEMTERPPEIARRWSECIH